MKGLGYKLIPILIIAIFIAIMTTGSFLKKPLYGDDDVIHYINNVKEDINKKSWKDATTNLKNAQKAWKKVKNRVQFSTERDELIMFGKNLERAKAFIKAHEKGSALAEISEAKYIWNELGK